MRAFFYFLIISFSFNAYSSNLVFGKPAFTRHFENPEDAIKPWKPVMTIVEAKYAKDISKFIVTETDWFYEGTTVNLSLYSEAGVSETVFPTAVGPYTYSSNGKTILFCESDGYEVSYPAKLYDLNGANIKELPTLGWSRDCGKSDDGTIYWQRYSKVMNGVTTSVIRFIGVTGDIIQTVESKIAEKIALDYQGRAYKFSFDLPQLPA